MLLLSLIFVVDGKGVTTFSSIISSSLSDIRTSLFLLAFTRVGEPTGRFDVPSVMITTDDVVVVLAGAVLFVLTAEAVELGLVFAVGVVVRVVKANSNGI